MRRLDLGPLREQQFRLLFAARAVSDTGSSIASVAYAFAILDLTGSASDLGLTFLARTLPVLAFVLAGGVLGDRLPRQRLMVGGDLVRALAQGTTAALLLAGQARLWELVLLQIVYGSGEAVFTPAYRGLTPQIVSVARLQQANALLSFSRNTNAVVGPALGGLLVALVEPGGALAADAASFAIGTALLLGIRAGRTAVPAAREPILAAVAVGWRAVRARTWLSASLAGDAVFQLLVLSSLFVLGPVVARQHLHGASSWATVLAAMGAGSLAGDAVALRYRPTRPLVACRLSVVVLFPAMVLLAMAAPIAAIAGAFVLAGAGFSVAGTLWFTLLQENVPPELRSRVSSFDTLVSRALLPLGYAVVGVVAGSVGAGAVLIGAGAIMACVQIATAALPSVRSLGKPVEAVPATL